jgi:hypothetical protein
MLKTVHIFGCFFTYWYYTGMVVRMYVLSFDRFRARIRHDVTGRYMGRYAATRLSCCFWCQGQCDMRSRGAIFMYLNICKSNADSSLKQP